MKHITCRIRADIANKLRLEPVKNRRWLSQSEIIRKVVQYYLEDQRVRNAVHRALSQEYGGVYDTDRL